MTQSRSIVPGRFSDDVSEISRISLGDVATAATNTTLVSTNTPAVCLEANVASIGTDVVVALVGSLTGVAGEWFQIGAAQTILANGRYGFVYPSVPVPFLGARLVSINTGTPTVSFALGVY